MLLQLRPGLPPSCRWPEMLHTPHIVSDAGRQVFWQVHMPAGQERNADPGHASEQAPGGCTCIALWVCLQGEREGLASLECEGCHASPHDWQVTRPCNVLHTDLARGAQGFHGLPVRRYACMWTRPKDVWTVQLGDLLSLR